MNNIYVQSDKKEGDTNNTKYKNSTDSRKNPLGQPMLEIEEQLNATHNKKSNVEVSGLGIDQSNLTFVENDNSVIEEQKNKNKELQIINRSVEGNTIYTQRSAKVYDPKFKEKENDDGR